MLNYSYFIEALPFFKDEDESCRVSEDQTLNDSNGVAYTFFVISNLIVGLGGAGVHIMGISYIDENLPKRNAAIYIGTYRKISAYSKTKIIGIKCL